MVSGKMAVGGLAVERGSFASRPATILTFSLLATLVARQPQAGPRDLNCQGRGRQEFEPRTAPITTPPLNFWCTLVPTVVRVRQWLREGPVDLYMGEDPVT